ncbi:MAG: 16S rRNA (adenine(1518)-N(6)/adenine(1519)-N(6))-dimethyltransferase RsmA [Nitriliruptorales bacterium]|nr:16S rRNA (adenine(1518)-N(6)/adenine(1519)-N(6))-dimethyltransferase RsmA [Nitriliruptorales bacterium]
MPAGSSRCPVIEPTVPAERPLLTPTAVRRLLAEHALAPSRRRGQNFVIDVNTVRKVVRDAGVAAGDLVVEIGPGLGSLTLALREAGARIIAVEIDAGLVRALTEVLGEDPGVRVIHADALATDLGTLTEHFGGLAAAPPRHPRLVANLPYSIATALVLRALETGVFEHLLVMVQREVGQRWAAKPGDPRYGAVSVKIAALAEARVAAAVPRGAFYPVPNVDSVTVALQPRPWNRDMDRGQVLALVEAGFAQRRKRLRNALARPERAPVVVEAALARAGLEEGARAEELDLDQWAALAEALHAG